MAISKRQRFEIFKRDAFTCQYCGRKPPAVILEIDHVLASAKGGSDDEHNLLTSCFDCNRGKSDRPLDAAITPVDVKQRAELLQERIEQTREYEKLLQEQRLLEDVNIDEITSIYEEAFPGWTLLDRTRPSIRNFLRQLPKPVVREAMEIACARMDDDKAFRYFCGICWRKIRDDGPDTQS